LAILWKNFEKLAKKGQILQTFCYNTLETLKILKKINFRFSRKNRPIFKTFCQNNEKFKEKINFRFL
jgi:hypothetical protein